MNTVSQNTVVLFQSHFNKSRDLKQLKAKKSKTNVCRLTHDLTQPAGHYDSSLTVFLPLI